MFHVEHFDTYVLYLCIIIVIYLLYLFKYYLDLLSSYYSVLHELFINLYVKFLFLSL